MSLIEAFYSMSLRTNALILLHINLIWQLYQICWSIFIIAYLYSNPIEMQALIQDADYIRIYFIYTTTTIALCGIYVSVLLSAIVAVKMDKYSIYALAVVIVFTSVDLVFTYWRTLYWYIVKNQLLQKRQLSNHVTEIFKNSSNYDNSHASAPIFAILIFILSYLVFNLYSVLVLRVYQLELLEKRTSEKKQSQH